MDSATKRVFFDDPLRISVPYCFLMKCAGKPPDNIFSRAIAFLGIVVIYVAVIGHRFWQFKCLQRASFKTSKPSRIFLASLQKSYQAYKDAMSGHSFNTDGIPCVIDNSATCIICNDRSQFVGPLWVQQTSVETTHGTASSLYAGTIAICLMTCDGQSFKYPVPNAIYDPHSPFNILGIPFFGDFFGSGDSPPTRDDEGRERYTATSLDRATG